MLELDGVRAGYGSTPILRNIDLSVADSEIVGVMGKNGVGKTTLIKTVIGQIQPSEGTVTFDGADVTEWPPHDRARRGMGYIPQSREIFPDLTVEQNLKMGESVNEDSDTFLYDEVYEYFPILDKRSDQNGGTLSGGQQQMLAISRALVANPDLLLLDEPSEGIQPSIVKQISEDMRAINDDLGTTILFVEQNLQVIRDLADRCYAMKRGTFVDELERDSLADEEALADFLAV